VTDRYETEAVAVELPDPEALEVRVAMLRRRARKALDAAGCRVGGDHLIEHIVEAIQAECRDLRSLTASLVFMLQERGVTMNDPMMPPHVNALGALALNLSQSYRQHDGTIGILLPDDGEG
jgi:hypothetical protein